MPAVWVPSLLRELTGGEKIVQVSAATVGEAITALEALYPGIKARLMVGERLRPGIVVVVDGSASARKLRQKLKEDSEVHFLPAIGGGSGSLMSFQRYLRAKRSVDDRALNRVVWQALEERLRALEGMVQLEMLEVGAGIGTMFERMVEWGLLSSAVYTLLDEQGDNIQTAEKELESWAGRQGLAVELLSGWLRLSNGSNEFLIEPVAIEMNAYLQDHAQRRWDVLVANALLDLMDIKTALPVMRAALKPGGLMYLTINFDGLTAFEPVIDAELDERIIRLYHRSMDERITRGMPAGDSRTGRKLLSYLPAAGLRILAAGSSDWIVYPHDGLYPADEAYFLNFVLGFFAESLNGNPELSAGELQGWLEARRRQIERGELAFLAHQTDYLVEAA